MTFAILAQALDDADDSAFEDAHKAWALSTKYGVHVALFVGVRERVIVDGNVASINEIPRVAEAIRIARAKQRADKEIAALHSVLAPETEVS